jgi:outer membrane protein TolC
VNVIAKKSRIKYCIFLILLFINIPACLYSQQKTSDSIQTLTLDQCIKYAFDNHPTLNRSLINKSIVKATNAINLSGWLPQISLSGNAIHYNQLPTTLEQNPTPGGQPIPVHSGVYNTVGPQLSVSQTIFNPQLMYAAKIAPLLNTQAEQSTDSVKISIVSTVSKSFYNLLLTLEQVNILKEDTARLNKNIEDTHHQYEGGLVDITDYEESVITLNNSKSQLRQQTENIRIAYATLKQMMGFPPEKDFNVVSEDTTQMMQQIAFDTIQAFQYNNRIEYQQLQTAKKLQHNVTTYNKLSFLPTLSASYNNFYEYESNSTSNLFSNKYPYSYFGLSLNIPLFTGFSRSEGLRKSKLQEQSMDWTENALKSEIFSEYTSALGNYKSNIYNWQQLKDNKTRAKNVYDIVALQYQQGMVSYINVIVAESNLITAEIGYINAFYQILSSKIDLEKAMGAISTK